MENLILTEANRNLVDEFLSGRLIAHERIIALDIVAAISAGNDERCRWFSQFGETVRHMVYNLHGYYKALEFGFDKIELDKYGWLVKAPLLEVEKIDLGDTSRYGNYSTISIGRGPNGVWTNAISCNYGVAGECSPLCVFGEQFSSRDAALNDALKHLKEKLVKKVGDPDCTNYHQDVISKTLKAIEAQTISMVQLTLF